MGDHDVIHEITTCLSVEPHDDNILDVCLHYFGCLRYNEQSEYFNHLSLSDQELIRERERRVQKIKDGLKHDAATLPVLDALTESLREFRPIPQTYLAQSMESEHLLGAGMSARMVLFKDGKPHRDNAFPRDWPDQKLPLDQLLYGASPENPLATARASKDMIQWFHLPANDMGWVEVYSSFFVLDEIMLIGDDRKPCLVTMAKRHRIPRFYPGLHH